MKINIVAIGKLKSGSFKDLCDDYLKRMPGIVHIKELDSPKQATSEQEARLIHKTLPQSGFLIVLDEHGCALPSVEFSKKMESWVSAHGGTLTFVIGGADGLTADLRQKADFTLSFGCQTWPHMLVRVMLLEQIYRARQIQAGHPYHRQ